MNYGTKAEIADLLRKVVHSARTSYKVVETKGVMTKGSVEEFLRDAIRDPHGIPDPVFISGFVGKVESATRRPFDTWGLHTTAENPEINMARTAKRIVDLCEATGWSVNQLSGAVADLTLNSGEQLGKLVLKISKDPVQALHIFPGWLLTHLPELTHCERLWILKGEGPMFRHGVRPRGPGGVLRDPPASPPAPPPCESPVVSDQDVQESLRFKPEPTPAPDPTPSGSASVPTDSIPKSDPEAVGIQHYLSVFRGQRFVTIQYRGRLCWPAALLSTLLGHDQKYLSQKITGDWASEFKAGQHYEVLRGEQLREFRGLLELVASEATSPIPGLDSRAPALTIVYETGFYKILAKSESEPGIAFREHIASEVMPQIVRTGSYITPERKAELLEENDLLRKTVAGYGKALLDQGDALKQVCEQLATQNRVLVARIEALEQRMAGQSVAEPPPAPAPTPADAPVAPQLPIVEVTVLHDPNSPPMRDRKNWMPVVEVRPRLEQAQIESGLDPSDVGPRMDPPRPRKYWKDRMSRLHRGTNVCIHLSSLRRIAIALGCSLNWLAWGTGEPWPKVADLDEVKPDTTP